MEARGLDELKRRVTYWSFGQASAVAEQDQLKEELQGQLFVRSWRRASRLRRHTYVGSIYANAQDLQLEQQLGSQMEAGS